jgi:PleD family two-component response regulator
MSVMPRNTPQTHTSILLIDGNASDRRDYAKQLAACSPDYLILEATNCPSGLALYRSRWVDCVVLELNLPDQWSAKLLVELMPIIPRPRVPVVVLSRLEHAAAFTIAKKNGVHDCYIKEFTPGDYLDRVIQRAMALVGRLPKEERHRTF